jgi:hypothetical protein
MAKTIQVKANKKGSRKKRRTHKRKDRGKGKKKILGRKIVYRVIRDEFGQYKGLKKVAR